MGVYTLHSGIKHMAHKMVEATYDDYVKATKDIPTPILLKIVRERNDEARERLGNWASMKKESTCPYCQTSMGVRELREHIRSGCRKQAKRKCRHCGLTYRGSPHAHKLNCKKQVS